VTGTRPVTEGVQASWLAIGLGVLAVVAVELAAHLLVAVIARPDRDVAAAALSWLRIAILARRRSCSLRRQRVDARRAGHRATPALRGVRLRGVRGVVPADGVRMVGYSPSVLTGSAVANVVGQWLAALLFIRALLVERVSLRPDLPALPAQMVMGRDLVLRTVAFQACFLSAAAVAARFGAAALAAHQVVLQLWSFLALVLDSLAIAAQSLVGAALGGGDPSHARRVAIR